MRRQSALRRAAILIMVSALAVGQSSPAAASNDLGHRVPSSAVQVGNFNLTALFGNSTAYVRTSLWNPTDLSTSVHVDGVARNVDLYDDYYGDSGWHGVYGCYNWQSHPTICKNSLVRFNLDYPPNGSWNATKANAVSCHEMGHALGLAHRFGTASCLDYNWSNVTYDAHDLSHINSWY